MELMIPYFSFQYKYKTQILIHGGKMSRPEKEFLLQPVRATIVTRGATCKTMGRLTPVSPGPISTTC